jgi:hypothetical protein
MSKLKLLKGDPIDLGICKVHPLLLEEVSNIGEEVYNQHLNILFIDKMSLKELVKDVTDEESLNEFNRITPYEALVIHALRDDSICSLICDSLSLFLKEKVGFHPIEGCFFIGEFDKGRIIDSHIFEDIKTIIRKQNYLEDKNEKETEFKPANDKAKELLEKRNKMKEKLRKQNNEDGLNLCDIISIVSTYSQDLNILSVWNLTVYQLYESYLRLIMWDSYHTNFMLIPHVSDSKSLELKHWASKINIKQFKEEK